MNILYLSCHSILEHDEVSLFTELGHNVFSLGAYQNPSAPQDTKRPALTGFYDEHLQAVAIQCSKDNLHDELIEWADVIIFMHRPDWILNNWPKIKHKKVIWRSIGQSTKDVESMLLLPKLEGLKLVRYSPEEKNIPAFAGEDAMIRFYKDPTEFKDWNGVKGAILTVAQSMKKRGNYCNFNVFLEATQNFPRFLFGPGNEDTGLDGGLLSYDDLKQAYRDYRVYFYTGTYPASYTLNFMEAMMTGIPIVAIGPKLADIGVFNMQTYEVHKIIENGKNGFCSDDIAELRGNTDYLLSHPDEAKRLGDAGRETAIKLFGKDTIKDQWDTFFKSL